MRNKKAGDHIRWICLTMFEALDQMDRYQIVHIPFCTLIFEWDMKYQDNSLLVFESSQIVWEILLLYSQNSRIFHETSEK